MAGPPQLIMFIRHGEKPSKDGTPPYGVKPDGTDDERSLIVRGWVRAGALVEFFGSAHDGIETPSKIYAASPGDDASPHGRRPSQTVTPLAAAHGIPMDTSFAVGEEASLAAALQDDDGVILISWEHHNIPVIVAAMGWEEGAATHWPDDRFDLVWTFSRAGEAYAFRALGQSLLEHDMPAE